MIVGTSQTYSQVVMGTVFDYCTGERVPDHQITVFGSDGSYLWTTTSNSNGDYSVYRYTSALPQFFTIRGGLGQFYKIDMTIGTVQNQNFYVLPTISSNVHLSTCGIYNSPNQTCNDPEYLYMQTKILSNNPNNPTPLGCGFERDWRVILFLNGPDGSHQYTGYSRKVQLFGGVNFTDLIYDSNWGCGTPRPEVNCVPYSLEDFVWIQDVLDGLDQGVYKIRTLRSCCQYYSISTHADGYISWTPDLIPPNVDFAFTGTTTVENANNDLDINGQLDECYPELPGALLGGISGGIVFNGLPSNNAISSSSIEIREVDCILGELGPVIYSNTWSNPSGTMPNPFSFAEVREGNVPTGNPYFLNSTNVAGKCFSLTFTATNPCNTGTLTQYFTVPNNLILWKESNENGFSENSAMEAKVYPTIFNDKLNVFLSEKSSGEWTFRLINMQGKEMNRIKLSNPEMEIPISTTNIPIGVYIWSLEHKDLKYSGKVMKGF